MALYRKKPVVIEAEEYKPGLEDGFVDNIPYIATLEGNHYISKGDYIITGIKGERYPCKPDIFYATYEQIDEPSVFGFDVAIQFLKSNKKVARSGWNGKGMFIFLVPGSTFAVNRPPLLGIYPEGTKIDYHAHIDMRTVDGQIVPWLASQTDLLAEDWQVVK